MFEDIQVGDTVYFSTPHTTELKGRAVMKGPAGWVVNTGGGLGTPRVVGVSDFIRLLKVLNRKPYHI